MSERGHSSCSGPSSRPPPASRVPASSTLVGRRLARAGRSCLHCPLASARWRPPSALLSPGPGRGRGTAHYLPRVVLSYVTRHTSHVTRQPSVKYVRARPPRSVRHAAGAPSSRLTLSAELRRRARYDLWSFEPRDWPRSAAAAVATASRRHLLPSFAHDRHRRSRLLLLRLRRASPRAHRFDRGPPAAAAATTR